MPLNVPALPFRAAPAPFGPVGLATSGLGALWYALLMRPVWAAASQWPICGHGDLWVVHCAACYAALALGAGGLALAALSRD